MSHRTWHKVFADQVLRGALRGREPEGRDPTPKERMFMALTPLKCAAMRGIWGDILCLVTDGAYSDDGLIQPARGVGYTDLQLRTTLNLTPYLWAEAKALFAKAGMIQVRANNVISVPNYRKYNSEYRRQKRYREAQKLQPDVTTGGCNSDSSPDVTTQGDNQELLTEGEREGERERDYVKKSAPPAQGASDQPSPQLGSCDSEETTEAAVRSLSTLSKTDRDELTTLARPFEPCAPSFRVYSWLTNILKLSQERKVPLDVAVEALKRTLTSVTPKLTKVPDTRNLYAVCTREFRHQANLVQHEHNKRDEHEFTRSGKGRLLLEAFSLEAKPMPE